MKHVLIKLARSDSERNLVHKNVVEIFEKTYGTRPEFPPREEHILYIEHEEKFVGSVGLFFSDEVDLMPHKKYFDFDLNSLPFNLYDEKHSYVTGWISRENNMGILLAYFIAVYAIRNNSNFAFSVMKPRVAQYLNKLSSNSWKKIEAVLDDSSILENDKIFFISEPRPSLYYCNSHDYLTELSKNDEILKLVDSTKIKF